MSEALPPPTSPPEPPRPRSHNPWPWIFLIILVLVGAFLTWQLVVLPRQMVESAGRATQQIVDTFGRWIEAEPVVTVNGKVTFEKPEAAFELTVLESKTTVESEFIHSHFGSKKRMQARGRFDVKVGYDLEHPIEVITTPGEPPRVRIEMPPPEILSLTQTDYEEVEYKEGLWNKITPEDREQQVEKLGHLAHDRARESGLLDEARARLQKRLQQVLGDRYLVEIVERTEAEPSAARR